MIVLDTNVLSELMRPAPNARVVRWFSTVRAAEIYTTSITQAEILHGIELLPSGKRRKLLEHAARTMFQVDFQDRILPFGSDAAVFYAAIAARRQRMGRPISQFDAQIAAIARANSCPLVSRNLADFEHCDVNVMDPWQGPA